MTALMRPLARHRQVDFRPTWSPYSLCLGWRRCRTMRATMASGLGQHARKKPSGGQAERRTGATLLWLMETWNRATPIRVFFLRSVLSWAPFLLWLTCPRPGRVTSAWPLCHTTGELVTRHRARGKHCHTSHVTHHAISIESHNWGYHFDGSTSSSYDHGTCQKEKTRDMLQSGTTSWYRRRQITCGFTVGLVRPTLSLAQQSKICRGRKQGRNTDNKTCDNKEDENSLFVGNRLTIHIYIY